MFTKKELEEIKKNNTAKVFSGADLQVLAYLPTKVNTPSENNPNMVLFGNIQTISISSTRSVSPVRVLGASAPLCYTRGARSVAGTMVFATLDKDVFAEIYSPDQIESFINTSSFFTPDLLPPMTIIITGTTETGETGINIIKGVTLVNYGSTFSIDDMYVEKVYTYIATDLSPFLVDSQYNRLRSKPKFVTEKEVTLGVPKDELQTVMVSPGYNLGPSLDSKLSEELSSSFIGPRPYDSNYSILERIDREFKNRKNR